MTELCLEIEDMCLNAIQSSNMNMITDDIHKEGLVGTLKDIMELIKDEKDEHDKD